MRHHENLISAETLNSHLDRTDWRVIDCRFNLLQPQAGQRSYLQEHIPGAVYAHLDDDLAAPVGPDTGRHPLPDPEDLARTFGQFGIGSDTQVVVYDEASGAIAARAWWLLRWLGHMPVAVLDGGLARWRTLGLPLQAGPVRVAARQFEARPRPGLVVETAELAADRAAGAALRVVDARDADRFRGEREPIDAVAGHVPSALNLPCAENLGPDGTWKSGPELHRMWSDVLRDEPDEPFSVMCGSGVSACQLVLSSLLAGLGEPRLYVGSWSEWIRDPRRPIATGPADG